MTIPINPCTEMKYEDVVKHFIVPENKYWFDSVNNSKFNFSVKESSERNVGDPWEFSGINQCITITCPLNDRNQNIFTHELLHSYLYANGFASMERYKVLAAKAEKFKNIFGPLEGGLLNSLQHIRMFPLFCNAGFNPSQFRTDYDMDYHVNERLASLEGNMSREEFFKNFIELFSIVVDDTDTSKNNCYSLILVGLNKIKSELYDILNTSTQDWVKKSDSNFEFDKIYERLISELEIYFLK